MTPTVTITGSLISGTSPATATVIPPTALQLVSTQSPRIQVADPAIAKSVDKNLVLPGETVTFTLIVTNSGDLTAPDVTVTDVLPAALIIRSAGASQGTFAIIGGTIVFSLGTVSPGQVITLTVVTQVSTQTAPPFDLINGATLRWPGGSSAIASNRVQVHVTGGLLPATGEHRPDSNIPIDLIGLSGLLIVGLMALIASRRQTSKRH